MLRHHARVGDALTLLSLLSLPLAAAGCRGAAPGDPAPRAGDEIVAAGQAFHATTPVVLWTDPGGYDAYRVEPRFPDELSAEAREGWTPKARYHSVRGHLPDELRAAPPADLTLADLRDHVDQFVVHYDVCGTSRRCFQVLQDQRGLSVHFLLDVDGTLYQALDLKERAWHAAVANDRSIGVEIANIGAYPSADDEVLARWYDEDHQGAFVTFPMDVTGIRTPGFFARPSRPTVISGRIQDQTLYQYDFTDEQYHALARLLATLHRVFPRLRLDAPRGDDGRVLDRALTEDELAAFSGVLGHYHVTTRKIDPGPAFDWERVLGEARDLAGLPPLPTPGHDGGPDA